MSVRLGISVEGQTEERFVKDVLAPHLARYDIYATPVIVSTSRSANGKKAKGGGINFDRVQKELKAILSGYTDGYVTSFYDFYGFDDRLPNETVVALEERINGGLGNPRNLISYVQLHEFESLLLSDPAITAEYFLASALTQEIGQAVQLAGGPEHVNDNARTTPSKRLEAWTAQHSPSSHLFSKRTKTLHGPQLAQRLTLPVIRAACPRFGQWLRRLETLAW